MVRKEDIPDLAICPKCNQPMNVVDLAPQAARLGMRVPEGSFVIECCGTELTIDDDELAIRVRDLLLAYHQEHGNGADPPCR